MQAMQSPAANDSSLSIPHSAFTVAGFEEWIQSDQFSSDRRVDLCCGEVLVDMSPEREDTHVKLKCEIHRVLANLLRSDPHGELFGDGITFSHTETELVTQPDALYFSFESYRSGRVRGGKEQGHPLGFCGSVDWILEVVSPSSRSKDRKNLHAAYAKAGVREYWIADALDGQLSLEIHRLGAEGYEELPSVDGWLRSETFDKDFRLTQQRSPIGLSVYGLQMR